MTTTLNRFKHGAAKTGAYALVCALGLAMVYPIVWMLMSSFKTNEDLFTSLSLLPKTFVWTSYAAGWKGVGGPGFGLFMRNSFALVLPTVAFTTFSSAVVAHGFARFSFPLKKLLFGLMISGLMLPNAVLVIPRYLIFRDLGWLNSYLPFIVPAVFACYPFFIFMMVQFFRGLPRELDESAYLDGCGPVRIFGWILLPLLKPALVSVTIFQFIWTWNDFFNALIYIDSTTKYTVSLALRRSIDTTGGAVTWNQVLAMTTVSILPPLLVFFFAQRYFTEGIATSGLKG
jgi:oligogalacturonide transport system permease protein